MPEMIFISTDDEQEEEVKEPPRRKQRPLPEPAKARPTKESYTIDEGRVGVKVLKGRENDYVHNDNRDKQKRAEHAEALSWFKTKNPDLTEDDINLLYSYNPETRKFRKKDPRTLKKMAVPVLAGTSENIIRHLNQELAIEDDHTVEKRKREKEAKQ
jgi:hypothetical protein